MPETADMRIAFIISVAVLLVMSACVAKPSCIKPYILVDGACCEDRNENGRCDSNEMTVEKEIVKEVGTLVENKTEVKVEKPIETPKESDKEAAEEIKASLNLTLPSFAYAIRVLELPVVERHALSSGQVSTMINGLTKSKLETLHYNSGYMTNWTNTTSVVQAVLSFRTSDDAETAFEEAKNHYLLENRFDKEDFRQIYDASAKMTKDQVSAVVIRRANVLSLLFIDGADVDMVVGEAEAALATASTPKLLPDIEPLRIDFVGSGPYKFDKEANAESNSIALGLADVVFTKKGTDWGAITSFKIIADNRGSVRILPKITLLVLDKDEKNPSSQDVELPELGPGDYAWKVFNSSMSIARLDTVKSLRVILSDGLSRSDSVLVSLTKDYTFS